MALKNDAFPSSAAFDAIAAALSDPTERAAAIKSAGAIFGITLKNAAGETASWHVDLKEAGAVGAGEAPAGKKATTTLVLKDADFARLVAGKANAQRLFMGGGLKIRGDVMKATKLEGVLKKAQTQGKAKL